MVIESCQWMELQSIPSNWRTSEMLTESGRRNLLPHLKHSRSIYVERQMIIMTSLNRDIRSSDRVLNPGTSKYE
jgi:hypothetical protein